MNYQMEPTYRPHQPDFELKPAYYSVKPTLGHPLYGIVWEFYQFDCDERMATPLIWVIPDACADFMAVYANTRLSCYLSGSAASYAKLDQVTSFQTFFGVRFCSGSLGNIFQVTAGDVAGSMLNCESALFGKTEDLKRLSEAATFEDRMEIMQRYILVRLSQNYTVAPLADYAVKYIVNSRGQVNVTELESLTGYSNRYIRKVFDEHVGVSPKLLCEIVQFQWSYHLYSTSKGKVNMAELAATCGYYDQTHMNKTYKKLASALPKNLPKLIC